MRDRIFVPISAAFLGAEAGTIFQAASYSAGDSPEYPGLSGASRVRPSMTQPGSAVTVTRCAPDPEGFVYHEELLFV